MNSYESDFGAERYKNETLLQVGAPSSKALRDVAHIIKEATIRQFANFEAREEEILQYGCLTGNPEFKEELAKYLSRMYRNPVKSEDLFINSGSSQGVSNLLMYYFRPGDTVFIEDPAYWVLLHALELHGFRISSVDVDEYGMKIDSLEKELDGLETRAVTARYPYRACVHVVPTYQNPTTVSMSEDRCKRLVELARKHDLLVIADDVYNLLTYSASDSDNPKVAKPPVRIFQYDDVSDDDYKGNVISVGSFSKILAPGLRLGWFEMPARSVAHFTPTLLSLGGAGRNPYASGIVAVGLKTGTVQAHVARMRCIYAERMTQTHKIIMEALGENGVRCELPRGGIFIWVVLPESITADEVLKLCGKEIGFLTGNRCSKSRKYRCGMRICITFYEEEVLYPAISKLCNYILEALNRGR